MLRYILFLLCLHAILSSTAPLSAQIVINEIAASNATILADPDYDDYSDWVELYNNSAATADVSGYALSDNLSDSTKWIIPNSTTIAPYGFLLVWADGLGTGGTALHTTYSLARIGEEVALFSPAGAVLDYVGYPEQQTDISYGRSTDGASTWSYFTTPTAGNSNNTATGYIGIIPYEPIVETRGGFYNAPISVALTNVSQVGVLRYTLTGAAPTLSSPLYTDPLDITQTTVLRVRVFIDGYIPGPIITNTYFVGENLEARGLPVMSLSTDPAYFWDNDIGLYVQDFKPEWEYPIHLEFYEADGLLGFHHDAGVKLDGENSWELPQKMLGIYSRKQYSQTDNIQYQLFPDNPRKQFENIILRCSGNDWSNTLFRDGMEQSLTLPNMDLDIQDFRPCIVYINGAYLGIHNIRTRHDEEALQQKYGVNTDSLDLIENDGEVKTGNAIAYTQMTDLLAAGVANNADFGQLAQVMDTENYTDYIINEMFCANTSWGHNIACWRAQNDTARFRWLLLDFDRGFFLNNVNDVAMDFFTDTNGANWSNPPWATLFLRRMLQNPSYRSQFVQRFADHLYTTYHPTTLHRRVNSFANHISTEMPQHIERWLGTTSGYGDAMPSLAYWQGEVQKLRDYAQLRNNFMYGDLDNYFNLNGTSSLSLNVSGATHGTIRLHRNRVTDYPWTGQYFNDIPILLTAEPKIGYRFARWQQTAIETDTLLSAQSLWQYSDAGTPPPPAWQQPDFDDVAWQSGNAQLGYGDGDENTVLDYGSDSNNKTPSYYFRQHFTIADPAAINTLSLHLIADDGAVVYINGTEALRYNMPTGTISFDTYAQSLVTNAAENAWQQFDIPISLLTTGNNTIAISVHQGEAGSSDVSFDAQLIAIAAGTAVTVALTDTFSLQLNQSAAAYTAVFEPTGVCLLPDTIATDLTLTAACSPYYAQGDVTILPNVHLTLEASVEVRMPAQASLWVRGRLSVMGTATQPCQITLNTDISNGGTTDINATWRGIFLRNTTQEANLSYLSIKKASAGLHRVYYPAALSAYRSDLYLDHLDMTDVADNPIFTRYANVVLTDSDISSRVTGDCINVKQGYGFIDRCQFSGGFQPDMDAIDYDDVFGGVVRNCVIHDFRGDNNDGMDIGEQCQNLIIERNFIYHCADKGVSCGQRSSASLFDNTIAYCNIGIALKDLSPINIDHCTLHACNNGIDAYEKNPGYKGGIGTVRNTIVSNSASAAYIADSLSILDVTYSLSDTDTLIGEGNITANPQLIDPTRYVFQVHTTSPAIGSSSDGSTLGAITIPVYTGAPQVQISEIYYNDTDDGEAEYIELYNPGTQAIDLSGYTLSEAVSFTFPTSTSLAPNSYLIVAENTDSYTDLPPDVLWQWNNGRLANEGETIVLTDRNGIIADFVAYSSTAPWADTTITYGKSLQLIADSLDNHFYTSWQISPQIGGTPATPNADTLSLSVMPVLPTATLPSLSLLAYPNPSTDLLQIVVKTTDSAPTTYRIAGYDAQGNCVWRNTAQAPPQSLQTYHIAVNTWAKGLYTFALSNAQGNIICTTKVLMK